MSRTRPFSRPFRWPIRTENRVYVCHTLPDASDLDTLDLELLKADSWPEEAMKRRGTIYALTWGRDTTPETADRFAAMVDADFFVTGHQPCDLGFRQANHRQIIIDGTNPYPCYCLFPADRAGDHRIAPRVCPLDRCGRRLTRSADLEFLIELRLRRVRMRCREPSRSHRSLIARHSSRNQGLIREVPRHAGPSMPSASACPARPGDDIVARRFTPRRMVLPHRRRFIRRVIFPGWPRESTRGSPAW